MILLCWLHMLLQQWIEPVPTTLRALILSNKVIRFNGIKGRQIRRLNSASRKTFHQGIEVGRRPLCLYGKFGLTFLNLQFFCDQDHKFNFPYLYSSFNLKEPFFCWIRIKYWKINFCIISFKKTLRGWNLLSFVYCGSWRIGCWVHGLLE